MKDKHYPEKKMPDEKTNIPQASASKPIETQNSTTPSSTPSATSETPQPHFSIEKLYVRDMSLEVPLAPQIYAVNANPEIEIQIHTEGKPLESAGWFDASIRVTVNAKAQGQSMFLVEVTQAGLFQIQNVSEADIQPILGITCPNILFPYLREVISDLVTRAGFPPFLLSPINFEGIYRERANQPADETTH